MGHSFGSFVAQQHMAAHGTAAGYVLMGTVDSVDALLGIDERLAAFEPEHLREQVARSWAGETTVQTAEEAAQLMRDQLPFHAAEPEGELVRRHAGDHRRHGLQPRRHAPLRDRRRVRPRGQPRAPGASSRSPCSCSRASSTARRPRPPPTASRSCLRDADEVVIPGAAHMLLQEQPAAALAALRAFLARVPA